MNKKIVVINGSGGSGKDTFIKIFQKYVNAMNYSSVDMIKKIALSMGWKGGKSERDRKFLSDLKLISTAYNDLPFRSMLGTINTFYMHTEYEVLFLHIREPEEVKRMVENCKAKSLLIKSKRVKDIKSNMADANVDNYNYDYVIHNDGDLNDLENEVKKFVTWLKEGDEN